MDLMTLLSHDRIAYEQDVSSKKRAFEKLAAMLASSNSSLKASSVFDALINREKLGSTALGNGVAIPHACMSLVEPVGALLIAQEGIKMDTPDKKPVYVLLALMVPVTKTGLCSPLMVELTTLLSQKSLVEKLCQFQYDQPAIDYVRAIVASYQPTTPQSLAA